MGTASAIIVVLITIVFPPAGAFLVAGCGVDLLINILLTCLGYIPGHLHAFYLEYIYYRNREAAMTGQVVQRAPGVYSDKVQTGGGRHGGMSTSRGAGYGNGYDNVEAGAPQQQGYATQGGYGTVPQDGARY